jgi:hypothetical protein
MDFMVFRANDRHPTHHLPHNCQLFDHISDLFPDQDVAAPSIRVQETLKEVLDSVAIVHYFVVNGDCGCG